MRASTEIGSRLRYALMSSARRGGKERHLVPVADTGVQLHVLQVHGSERPLGQLAGAWQLLAHPADDVGDRGRQRHKHRCLVAPYELRVAREEAYRHRSRPRDCHGSKDNTTSQPPAEPVVRPFQTRACFGDGDGASESVNVVAVRSCTVVARLSVWPFRRTTRVSGWPALPRQRAPDLGVPAPSGSCLTTPTLTIRSPRF